MTTAHRAILVGIHTRKHTVATLRASLAELARLCDTLGLGVAGAIVQKRDGTGSMNVLGEGKLQELAAWTGGPGTVDRGPQVTRREQERREKRTGVIAEPDEPEETEPPEDWEEHWPGDPDPMHGGRYADIVVVDAELSPSQLRNLSLAAGCEVLDRTGLILEIFHRNAKTREAKLQVELARLAYLAPRLRESGAPSERTAGKGAGESSVELDRRRVRDRMSQLRTELAEIDNQRGRRRARRSDALQVALVGYTNAGKSSLLRALTGAEPYVADQLFATLDTTIRRLQPDSHPSILVTDTVGFIRDLPHDLVASFRSTLDAALDASLILHIVDAGDADLERQLAVTAEVLTDIGAGFLPRWLVLNKADTLTLPQCQDLLTRYPNAVFTSAKDPDQVALLATRLREHFGQVLREATVFIAWDRAAALGAIREGTEILEETFEDEGVRYRLRGTESTLLKLQALISNP